MPAYANNEVIGYLENGGTVIRVKDVEQFDSEDNPVAGVRRAVDGAIVSQGYGNVPGLAVVYDFLPIGRRLTDRKLLELGACFYGVAFYDSKDGVEFCRNKVVEWRKYGDWYDKFCTICGNDSRKCNFHQRGVLLFSKEND